MYGGFFSAANTAGAHAAARTAINTSHQAVETASNAKNKIEAMQMDIEKLLMITEALWGILKEEHGYDDEELLMRVQEIDMRDGRLDGKVKSEAPPECPECGRTLIGKRPICLYCGAEVQRDLFER